MQYPRKLSFSLECAVGDAVVASATIKALHETQPGLVLTDYTGFFARLSPDLGNDVFANNPYITPFDENDPDVEKITLDYGYGLCGGIYGGGCGRSYHFLHSFAEYVSAKIGVHIELRDFRGDIWLSEQEQEPWLGMPAQYAVIDAGIKHDFTAKGWSVRRFQEVVNRTKDKIAWVQVGGTNDIHPNLDNVINMVGKTNIRQLIQIVHHSSLVLTPVSLPMHLAAAVQMPGEVKPLPWTIAERHLYHATKNYPDVKPTRIRPCVVIAGSREQRAWEQYPGHTWIGDDRKLSCGIGPGKACWHNKTIRVDQDQNVCSLPVLDAGTTQWIPHCLDLITTDEVVNAIEKWL